MTDDLTIRSMCSDIYEGGDWEPMIDLIEQKDKKIKELNDKIEDDKMIIEGNWGCIDNLRKDYNLQKNIIKEVREWAKKCSCQFINDDGELVVSEISFNIQARPCDLFKILDKEP